MSDLCSSSEENVGMEEESKIFSMSISRRLTQSQKIINKFNKCVNFSLTQGGLCSYDDERKSDFDVPFKYTHLQKQWVLDEFPLIQTYFCVRERIYLIASSSLHGFGLFSIDGINFSYKNVVELMEYVRPCYDYNSWM